MEKLFGGSMTIISLLIQDEKDGSVSTKFVATRPLPEKIEDYTPAELFATELKNELDKLTSSIIQ